MVIRLSPLHVDVAVCRIIRGDWLADLGWYGCS